MYFSAENPFPRVITLLLNLGIVQWIPASWKEIWIFRYWNPIVLTLLLGKVLLKGIWAKWKKRAQRRDVLLFWGD